MAYNPINYRYITKKNKFDLYIYLANELGHQPVDDYIVIVPYKLIT
jgi:hypothetical protein